MEKREIWQIIVAIIVIAIVLGFSSMLSGSWNAALYALIFSVILVFVVIFSKKAMAYLLDADVEHELWQWQRYGFQAHQHMNKPAPLGAILPLLFSIVSKGFLLILPVLTYETRASKYRASKRFGYYSYVEMTDWHNGIIGATGIISVLILAIICYFAGFEYFAMASSMYALVNMIPFSKLDGTQIFFGSRILWATLAAITLIFACYPLIIA